MRLMKHATHLFRIDPDGEGISSAKSRLEFDLGEDPSKRSDRLLDDGVDVGHLKLDLGHPGKARKLVHQRFDGSCFLNDGLAPSLIALS